jgi:hypothetical protein
MDNLSNIIFEIYNLKLDNLKVHMIIRLTWFSVSTWTEKEDLTGMNLVGFEVIQWSFKSLYYIWNIQPEA